MSKMAYQKNFKSICSFILWEKHFIWNIFQKIYEFFSFQLTINEKPQKCISEVDRYGSTLSEKKSYEAA
jgi:hypothetical protein